MTIDASVAEKKQSNKLEQLNAVVLQRIEVTPGLIILRVAPDGWHLRDFQAGQFAVLGLPPAAPRCAMSEEPVAPAASDEKLIKRAYSIASSSVSKEFIEFYLALVPTGELTPRLFALKPGDRLWMGEKITGMFTLGDVPVDKDLVLIATGTGLAPYMSMLRSELSCGTGRSIAVLHGARHSWELGYRSELTMMHRLCPNFTYVPTISRPQAEIVPWAGHAGYIQEIWSAEHPTRLFGFTPTPDKTHIFLCGNPGMIDQMVEKLSGQGYQEHSKKRPGSVHVERYW